MDELGISRMIASGDLASPQRYENVSLFAMRITGTGVAYRAALNEFVYRRPENYLTPEFLARCAGLPVIMLHPKQDILDSSEFADRVVGTVLLPYLQEDEVWGVAKIYDDEAIAMLGERQMSTSPAVLIRSAENLRMELEDGSNLLIEGKPSLLDHLAICEHGVWDKGEGPNGIKADISGDQVMADEDKKNEDKEVEKKADAGEGTQLDKVLSHLDTMSKRLDSVCGRMDSYDEESKKRADAARKDDDEAMLDKRKDSRKDADEKGGEGDDDKAKRLAADARKDAEEKEEETKKVADSVSKLAADNDALKKQLAELASRLPRQIDDAEHTSMIAAQAHADSVYSGFGKSAPRPLDGETPASYRRRLAEGVKRHSKSWKEIDLSHLQDAAFDIAEKQIFADAAVAAKQPDDLADGELREIAQVNPITGARSTEFRGRGTFIGAMSLRGRRASINNFQRAPN